MKDETKNNINLKEVEKRAIATMIGKPLEFEVAGKSYHCPPPSFGKMQMLALTILDLDFNEKQLLKNPMKEAMKICAEKTDKVCEFMAIATLNTQEELQDTEKIKAVANEIKWNSNVFDLIPAVVQLITQLDCGNFIHSIELMKTLNINKDAEETKTVE